MKMCRVIMVMTVAICSMVINSIADAEVEQPEKVVATDVPRDNYIIKLHGTYADSTPVDLTLTGCGFDFELSLANPELTFRGTLNPIGNQVHIDYTFKVASLIQIGMRYTGRRGGTNVVEEVPDYQLRHSTITGSALLTSGKPLAIITVNQNKLELSATKATE